VLSLELICMNIKDPHWWFQKAMVGGGDFCLRTYVEFGRFCLLKKVHMSWVCNLALVATAFAWSWRCIVRIQPKWWFVILVSSWWTQWFGLGWCFECLGVGWHHEKSVEPWLVVVSCHTVLWCYVGWSFVPSKAKVHVASILGWLWHRNLCCWLPGFQWPVSTPLQTIHLAAVASRWWLGSWKSEGRCLGSFIWGEEVCVKGEQTWYLAIVIGRA